jgi:glutamate dehydrogenase
MIEGRLELTARNTFLAEMRTRFALVLEDNRLQTLALSIAERGGPTAVPALVRAIELLEESGPPQPAGRGAGEQRGSAPPGSTRIAA